MKGAGSWLHRGLLAAAVGVMCVSAESAVAQSYPTRPLRLVAPTSPGGTSDVLARALAAKLTEALGQPVIVENRPGASSMIGAESVAKSVPDGYTLLVSPAALSINPSMYAKVPFNTLRDLAPVTLLAETGNVLVVHPSVPAMSVKQFIALARKNPGSLAAASPGRGGSPHMSAELLKVTAGIDFLIVSYKGSGPGVTALLSGEVAFMFTTPPSAIGHIRAGRLRPLGMTTRARIAALPDVPTISEAALPGFEATQWFGLLVPGGTPQGIIDRLHQETVRAIGLADMKAFFASQGLEPVGNKPEEFAAHIRAELDKWAKVIKAAGIKPQGN
jgi:tripartite-type tricarboxylate transporter receptor subunit TctC